MSRVRLIAVPLWQGAALPGVASGPAALVEQLAARGWKLAPDRAAGDATPLEWVAVPTGNGRAHRPGGPAAPGSDAYAARHHLDLIRTVAEDLAPRVAAARRAGELPIVLGGDHALTIGSFGGARLAAPDARLGIVWVDAHPDLNTPETTPSHHGHGMPLAALLGHGHPALVDAVRPGAKLAPADVVLFGTRAIDPGEARFLAERPELLVVPAAEVHDRGLASALERVLARIAELDAVHLSFDLDAVDSAAAPGVTTPVSHGLTPAEALELVSAIARSGKLVSADVVELTPERDPDGRTARLAADLVARIAAAEPEVAPVPAPDVLQLTADLA